MEERQERFQKTRARLMRAFREAFLREGYEATTTARVLARAGLSKGALYHHFKSKAAVMEAIYEDESRRAIGRALASVDPARPPLERLRLALVAWTGEVRARTTSRILFEIGPSALGARRAREIEATISLIHIERLLREATEAGEIADADAALTAAMLNALVGEAALYALRTGKDPGEALGAALAGLLGALRRGQARSGRGSLAVGSREGETDAG